MTKIWKKMGRKAYRDSFVGAHVSNTIASQIVMLREKEGWTQTQLAERAGMKQSRISALEDPNYENIEVATLRRLASAFDVAVTVRFVPFSELARWSVRLSEENLLVQKFEEDELVGLPHAPSDGTSAALAAFLRTPEQSTATRFAPMPNETKSQPRPAERFIDKINMPRSRLLEQQIFT